MRAGSLVMSLTGLKSNWGATDASECNQYARGRRHHGRRGRVGRSVGARGRRPAGGHAGHRGRDAHRHPDALGVTNIGSFSGRLVATGPGGVAVQTGFGVTTETESFDVKV